MNLKGNPVLLRKFLLWKWKWYNVERSSNNIEQILGINREDSVKWALMTSAVAGYVGTAKPDKNNFHARLIFLTRLLGPLMILIPENIFRYCRRGNILSLITLSLFFFLDGVWELNWYKPSTEERHTHLFNVGLYDMGSFTRNEYPKEMVKPAALNWVEQLRLLWKSKL